MKDIRGIGKCGPWLNLRDIDEEDAKELIVGNNKHCPQIKNFCINS